MESLLDQADALVLTAGEEGPERPNFAIPEELTKLTTPNGDWLEIRENPNKGKGWFSKVNIPAGSPIFVCKALVCALDLEYIAGNDDDDNDDDDGENEMDDDDEEEEEDEAHGSQVNELLVLDLLQNILDDPSIWLEQLTNLYPREEVDIKASPIWISKDDAVFSQFEAMKDQIEKVPALVGKSKEISERLPLIIRYNVLSIETCPELLSHPGANGHHPLSGVGLYYWPSFFNHDSRPNISRYAVGDVMWFVANQDIVAGGELCISYLEQDILCENTFRRNCMLTLDFKVCYEYFVLT